MTKQYKTYVQSYKPSNNTFSVYYKMYFSNYHNKKILDVGCSIGNFLVHCNKDSFGIDRDERQLQVARDRPNVK